MIKNSNDVEKDVFDLKIQYILNKRLFNSNYISKDLYEKVESNLSSKINKLK